MNSDTDFFLSIAAALGIQCNYKANARVLRMKIEYILQHTGLMLIMDEAHFLLPASAHRALRPTRLNWVRACVVDRRLPVALVTTPQAFKTEMDRVKRAYNFDQWDGRIDRHIILDENISVEDLLAVVRHKAPDFSPAFHKIISGAAILAVNYYSAVKSIVDTAEWIAKRAGREQPTLADLKAAIAEAVPNAAVKHPVQPSRSDLSPLDADAEIIPGVPPGLPPPAPPRPVATKRTRAAAPAPAMEAELQKALDAMRL
jgi:hypothetical protein